MPLEICKYSRRGTVKICKENFDTAPNQGYCASQQMRYFGYKLHAVCTIQGVFKSFDLSKEIQMDLFSYQNINLEVPMRKNQKDYKSYPSIFKKHRKRIETLFPQICDQFMIRRNYAKTFQGFKTRIRAKITALITIQLINKLENRNINNLKIQIT